MFISPKAYQSLVNVESISPRIMVATFNGNPKTTVISCYNPTNCFDELEIQNIYHQLTDSIENIPKPNVLIIGGDINAKIDNNKCLGNSYHNYTNRNGEYLLYLTIDCGLINIFPKSQKNKGNLWTFIYPNGTRSQLDYILINRKWKNNSIDCRSFNTYSPLESNHRVCTAKIRLSLKSNISKSKKTMTHDWSKLLNDAVEIRNRFEQLQNLNPDNFSKNDIHENIIKAHAKAAEKYVPKKIKPKRDLPWENDVVFKEGNELNEAFKRKKEKNDLANTLLVEKAKKDLNHAYDKEQKNYVEGKIKEIKDAHINHHSRLVWDRVNEVTRRKGPKRGRIKTSNTEERFAIWKDHFQKLLEQSPEIDDQPVPKIFNTFPIKTGEFTAIELQASIKSFQNNKATGFDNIPIET